MNSDTNVKTYNPHEYQAAFHASLKRFRILYAGRRGGKSVAGSIESNKHAFDITKKDIKGAIIAPTYTDMTKTVIPLFFEFMPIGYETKWSGTDFTLKIWFTDRYINGIERPEDSIVYFLSARDASSLGHGLEFDWVWIDEARDFIDGSLAWNTLYPTLLPRKGKVWITTTTAGYDWVYDNFFSKAGFFVEPTDLHAQTKQPLAVRKDPAGDQDISIFRYRTVDNSFLPDIESEVAKAKTRMTEQMWHQEYFATLEKFSGLVYPDFDEKVHVIDTIKEDQDDLYFISIDSGYNNATAVGLWLAKEKGDMYLLDELFLEKMTVKEIVPKIKAMIGERDIQYYLIDPSAGAIEHTSEMSIADQYLEHGIATIPARNDVRAGINRVTEFIKANKIKLLRHCANHIREFQRYEWKHTKEGSTKDEAPKKTNDHCMDSCRYMLMSRPELNPRIERDVYGFQIREEGESDLLGAPQVYF